MRPARPAWRARYVLLAVLVAPCLPAAGPPGTFLQLDDGTLRVTAGRPVRMTLTLPGGETWSTANVGRFQVRTYGAAESLVPDPSTASKEVTHRFDQPGDAVVLLAAGPASARGRTDSVGRTPYCAKLLVRVDPPGPRAGTPVVRRSPDLTAKAGLEVEACAYRDPTGFSRAAVEQGTDLPVRVYFEGESQAGRPVTAYGPDGSRQTDTSDARGIATFRIDRPGRWLVRYEHPRDGVTYTGDLVFEVGAAWGSGK